MPKPEHKFRKKVIDGLKSVGVICLPIESPTTPGLPDIHWLISNDGTSGWLELKVCEDLTETTRIKYRPQQALWLEDYSWNKGRCGTLLLIQDADEMLLIPGFESRKAERCISTKGCISHRFRADNRVNWGLVKEALRGLNR